MYKLIFAVIPLFILPDEKCELFAKWKENTIN